MAKQAGDYGSMTRNVQHVREYVVQALTDMMIRDCRSDILDNAKDTGWHDGKEQSGAEPESEDERMGKGLYDAATAPVAGNATIAYHLTRYLPYVMQDLQDELRERFGLPAWNPMHECQDLIGDTDGLGPDVTEQSGMALCDCGHRYDATRHTSCPHC